MPFITYNSINVLSINNGLGYWLAVPVIKSKDTLPNGGASATRAATEDRSTAARSPVTAPKEYPMTTLGRVTESLV